jgi:hypothetical protein
VEIYQIKKHSEHSNSETETDYEIAETDFEIAETELEIAETEFEQAQPHPSPHCHRGGWAA